MLRSPLHFAVLVLAVFPSTGCATLVASSPSVLEVDVNKPASGAIVTVEDIESKQYGTYRHTPVKVKLNKRRHYSVNVSASGYVPAVQVVRSETEPMFWLNWVPIGLLGVTVPLSVVGSIASGSQTLVGGMAISAGLLGLGVAGMAIDMQTGNAWRHDRSHVSFELLRSEE